MSKSEDVTKLFAMFGEKNTGQYQEIYESEQNRATRERWPVFQRIHVDADAPESSSRPSGVPKAPLSRPFVPVERHETQSHATTSGNRPVQKPVASSPPAETPGPEVQTRTSPFATMQAEGTIRNLTSPASADRLPETTGSLRALFQRLEKHQQAPAPVQVEIDEPESTVAAEPPKGSIRSLFSRLSR